MVTEHDQRLTEEQLLLDHNYDGIRELDNDLPPWWKNLFYVTIIFAVVYLFYYHVLGAGDSQTAAYINEMQSNDPNYLPPATVAKAEGFQWDYTAPYYGREDLTPQKRAELDQLVRDAASKIVAAQGQTAVAAAAALKFDQLIVLAMSKADSVNLAILQTDFPAQYDQFKSGAVVDLQPVAQPEALPEMNPLTDVASLAAGAEVFKVNCIPCHNAAGEGGIGPNLTDNYWIHGGKYSQIVNTINIGVPAKGMIAWNRTLKPNQIQEVASFIRTLKGTNPPNPKDPQGTLYEGD